MTPEEHKQRHIQLHKAFDALLADWIMHHPMSLPSQLTVLDLAKWSYQQTIQPEVL